MRGTAQSLTYQCKTRMWETKLVHFTYKCLNYLHQAPSQIIQGSQAIQMKMREKNSLFLIFFILYTKFLMTFFSHSPQLSLFRPRQIPNLHEKLFLNSVGMTFLQSFTRKFLNISKWCEIFGS